MLHFFVSLQGKLSEQKANLNKDDMLGMIRHGANFVFQNKVILLNNYFQVINFIRCLLFTVKWIREETIFFCLIR